MEAAAHGHSTLGIPKSVGEEFVKADGVNETCAGILLRANGRYLLVQNADDGQWVQPGGHVEAGEALEDAAVRECMEEVGSCPDGIRWLLRKSVGSGVDFTCYMQECEPFEPKIDDESLAAGWFSANDLPDATHPEVAKSIALVSGNELDIAKAIRANELSSPQQYENIWLFDVRITGTGTSYRQALEEYVYRPPEDFLTEEFVERCNGLPLIFEHPKASLLNTEEYRDRAIGVVILPYIQGDEVRGIAKVFDADAAHLMLTSHVSTSPAVVFRDAGSTETIELSDGKTVLIEGKPSYLDHLAICEEGVWDKGGTPNGVNINEDTTLDENEKVPAWADALNKRFDEVCGRMDAIEGKGEAKFDRKDSEEEVMDRKDSEEEEKGEKKEEKKDARKDSEKEEKAEKEEKKDSEEKEERKAEKADSQRENAELRKRIADMDKRLSEFAKPLSHEDREALATAQHRADSLAQLFGDSVAPPMHNESAISYRMRLAAKFQKHVKNDALKGARLDSLDAATFSLLEDQIYADAQSAAMHPAAPVAGRLIPQIRRDDSGRQITTYTGDIGAWMAPFTAPGVIAKINSKPQGVH